MEKKENISDIFQHLAYMDDQELVVPYGKNRVRIMIALVVLVPVIVFLSIVWKTNEPANNKHLKEGKKISPREFVKQKDTAENLPG